MAISSAPNLRATERGKRHPNGDELVQIVDGSATLHTMTEDGPKSYAVSAGMIVIVPQGTWHRFQV